MPCKECESGMWKWGERGDCQYESLSDCEEANTEYYLDEVAPKIDAEETNLDIDHQFDFTSKQMEELHTNGELIVTVEGEDEDGEPTTMNIKFTYNAEEEVEEVDDEEKKKPNYKAEEITNEDLEKEYAKLTVSMLDDELDEYIDKIAKSIKKL